MRAICFLILLFIMPNCFGEIIYVDDDLLEIPDAKFTNIQDAIDYASNNGDKIIVAPGNYYGNPKSCSVIDITNKSIIIESQKGKLATYLDGQSARRVINIDGNQNQNILIKGFTVRNGYAVGFGCGNFSYAGGGLLCSGPIDVDIQDCIFNDNSATLGGGLATAIQALATISNCSFFKNTASGNGGGLYTLEISYIDMKSGSIGCNTPNDVFGQAIISSDVCIGTCDDLDTNNIPDTCEIPPDALGDINEDGIVNTLDLLELISSFNSYSYLSDLNVDSAVNTIDLLILLSKFGTSYPGACCFTNNEEWYCMPDFGNEANCENSGGNFAGPLEDCNGDCWF